LSYARGDVTGTGSNVYTGGLAGDIYTGSSASSCYATGNVSGTGSGYIYAGGVAGLVHYAGITECYALGDVSGTGTGTGNILTGGVAGYINASNISSSYAVGDVSGTGTATGDVSAGGVAGYIYSNSSVIACYAVGDVSGTGRRVVAGGIIGYINASGVDSCYALGDVRGTGTGTGDISAGGATAFVYTGGTLTAAAALNRQVEASGGSGTKAAGRVTSGNSGTVSGNAAYAGMVLVGASVIDGTPLHGNGKTAAELTHGFFESLFDFSTYYKWLPDYPYPALKWQSAAPPFTPLL
jgi:hypothetical protein